MVAQSGKKVGQRTCTLDDLTIEPVDPKAKSDLLDSLLWEVLWQPLGMPRDIRRSFGFGGDCLELAAEAKGLLIGGLVAGRPSFSEAEIRHIAVRPGFQRMGVGRMLVEHLVERLINEGCLRLHVIARNTSQRFFEVQGFSAVECNMPDHPDFKKFGISFVLMEMKFGGKHVAVAAENPAMAHGRDFEQCPPEGFSISEFRAPDLKQLRQIICHTIDVCYSGVYPQRAVQFFKEYHSEGEIVLRGKRGTILIAWYDEELAATGALVGNEITGVFVAPHLQGRGFGSAVMQELERLAQGRGHKYVELSVSLPSRKFYESLGYVVLSDCTIDVGDGERLDYWMARKTFLESLKDERP